MYSHKTSKQFSSVQNQPGKCCVDIWFSNICFKNFELTVERLQGLCKGHVTTLRYVFVTTLAAQWLSPLSCDRCGRHGWV